MKNKNLDCIIDMRVVVQDLATQWIQSYPCTTTSAEETQRSLGQVSRPEENLRSMFTDTSLEFIQACVELNWTLERSTWIFGTSCMTSERTHFVSFVSVWTSRKLMGRSHGVLLLSSICARLAGRKPDTK